MSDDAYRMVPEAGERQQHTITKKWRFVCHLDGCTWRSTERDTAEETDDVAVAHFENAHGATQVVKTP